MLDAFDLDSESWFADRERATSEYGSEMREWEQAHPRPKLGEYMKLQGKF